MPATARTIVMIATALTLSACQEDGSGSSGTNASSTPLQLEEVRRDCERDGGSWGTRGQSLFVCYLPASDANQFCRAASDCESVCLARSSTCAPTVPFLGCHEVLTEAGQRATQCTN